MYWNVNEDIFAPVDYEKPVMFEYSRDELSRSYRKHHKSTSKGFGNTAEGYSYDRILDAYNESKNSEKY